MPNVVARFVLGLMLVCMPLANSTATEVVRSCAVNADDMAARVKAAVSPRYQSTPDPAALAETLAAVEALLLEAGHCSASARSHTTEVADRQRNIMEWHSINQWLARLAGSLQLDVNASADAGWRDEYRLFAEVYEFEP